MKIVVLLLGEDDVYLGNQQFINKDQADEFVNSLHELMLANIEKDLTLKQRLKLAPAYFPWAGLIQDIEYIEINQ